MNNNRPKHDQLFRKTLENPMVAHELLQTHMCSDVFALLDMSTLKLEKESFVEADLTNSISDVLFSTKFNVSFLSDFELEYMPGTKMAYSNAGIALLGRIIEIAAEKPFETLVKEKILY